MTNSAVSPRVSSATEREELILGLARKHPTLFTRLIRRRYVPADLHWRIGDALRRVESGEIDRLMIFVPPRHGKSTLTSLAFPAWYLGRNPDKRVIAASYGDALVRGFGRGARNLIAQPLYQRLFPGLTVSRESAAADAWSLNGYEGGYIGTSVGGAITGLGAHVLLIDDPVKSREEADSEVMRDKTWDWFTNDAYTRLEDGGAIIVIQTRWHELDLAGRLLADMADGSGDQWEVLDLPALDAEGRALWPEKYDIEALARIRRTIGERAFTALYQQRPAPAEGAMFKLEWMQRRYDVIPRNLPRWRVVQYVDTATREGVGVDYSVIATWATDGISYYLVDVWRDRVDYPQLKTAVQQQYWLHKPQIVLVEDTTHGRPLVQELRTTTQIPLAPQKVTGTKETRAEAVTPMFEASQVVLPQRAHWLDAWIQEHLSFPQGAHDDQVDTTSGALGYLARGGMMAVAQEMGRVKW